MPSLIAPWPAQGCDASATADSVASDTACATGRARSTSTAGRHSTSAATRTDHAMPYAVPARIMPKISRSNAAYDAAPLMVLAITTSPASDSTMPASAQPSAMARHCAAKRAPCSSRRSAARQNSGRPNARPRTT
ncbi:hypothetical protein D3C81_1504970 [compost metagenome]